MQLFCADKNITVFYNMVQDQLFISRSYSRQDLSFADITLNVISRPSRSFVNISSVLQVFDCIMNYKKEEAASLMKKLGVELKPEDREKDGKQLLKVRLITQLFKGVF